MPVEQFDLETAIATWRRSLGGLTPDDLDELESHLRDELDALAEVELTGVVAFEHATRKLGSTAELVDEMERAAPSVAWRAPAAALLMGFLVNILGASFVSILDLAIVPFGRWLQPGPKLVTTAVVAVVLVAPLVAVGGGFRLATRIVERVERTPAWMRVAVVVGMGLFVLAANSPLGVLPVSPEFVSDWASWRVISGPARRGIAFALPFLFAVALYIARRRDARFAVWAILGYLAKSFGGALWMFSATAAARVAASVDRLDTALIERTATTVSLFMPALAVVTALSLRTRITPTRFVRSRFAEITAVGLVLGITAMRLGDQALLQWHGFFAGGFDAIGWSYMGGAVLANLCLAPVAAAGLLRLRTA